MIHKFNYCFFAFILLFYINCQPLQPKVNSGVYFRKNMKEEYKVLLIKECIDGKIFFKALMNNSSVIVRENKPQFLNFNQEEKRKYEDHEVYLQILYRGDGTMFGRTWHDVSVFIDENIVVRAEYPNGCWE